MMRSALLIFLSSMACLLLVLASGCEGGGGHTTTHIGVSYGYYGGGWYDPYYRYPPGYGRPVGPPPPGYRPPSARPPSSRPPGGRPSQLPSGPRPMPRGQAR